MKKLFLIIILTITNVLLTCDTSKPPMRYSFKASAIEIAFTKCALDLESSRLSRTLLVGKTLPDSILIMGQQLANEAARTAPAGHAAQAKAEILDKMPCVMRLLLSPDDSHKMQQILDKRRSLSNI